MRKVLYLMPIFLWLINCSITEKPIFIKVDHIKIIKANARKVILKADAFFKNPNHIGGELTTDSIQVWINGEKIAKVSSEPFKIPAREEFTVPMLVEIPTKRIFENNKDGILSGLINAVLNKRVKVQFKGNLYYKVLGYSNAYTIDKTQEIKL